MNVPKAPQTCGANLGLYSHQPSSAKVLVCLCLNFSLFIGQFIILWDNTKTFDHIQKCPHIPHPPLLHSWWHYMTLDSTRDTEHSQIWTFLHIFHLKWVPPPKLNLSTIDSYMLMHKYGSITFKMLEMTWLRKRKQHQRKPGWNKSSLKAVSMHIYEIALNFNTNLQKN